MRSRSIYPFIALLVLTSSIAGGASGRGAAPSEAPIPTPLPGTDTPQPTPSRTRIPPSATSAPTPTRTLAPGQTIVASVGDLAGTWTAWYVEFGRGVICHHEDGTWEMAATVAQLDSDPALHGTFQFEGAEMTTWDTDCGTGVTEVRITRENGVPVRLDFRKIRDRCAGRVADMGRGMVWVGP